MESSNPKREEEVRQKKKTKLFNKIYVEMQNAMNTSFKKKFKVHNVSSYRSLLQFEKAIDSNYKLYENCDEALFEKSIILQRLFYTKPQLSNKNKEVVWKYIQMLYSLMKEENKQIAAVHKKEGLESLVESLMGNENSGFKTLVDDISSQLQQATLGKDINEQNIVNDLLSGNLQSSGIDFKKIIESTSKNLEKKINNGEIDREEIMKTTDKIKNTLNLH